MFELGQHFSNNYRTWGLGGNKLGINYYIKRDKFMKQWSTSGPRNRPGVCWHSSLTEHSWGRAGVHNGETDLSSTEGRWGVESTHLLVPAADHAAHGQAHAPVLAHHVGEQFGGC